MIYLYIAVVQLISMLLTLIYLQRKVVEPLHTRAIKNADDHIRILSAARAARGTQCHLEPGE